MILFYYLGKNFILNHYISSNFLIVIFPVTFEHNMIGFSFSNKFVYKTVYDLSLKFNFNAHKWYIFIF